VPYLSASAVVIHYVEALYQVYAPLPIFYGNVAGWVTGWLAGCLSHAGIVSKRLNL